MLIFASFVPWLRSTLAAGCCVGGVIRVGHVFFFPGWCKVAMRIYFGMLFRASLADCGCQNETVNCFP